MKTQITWITDWGKICELKQTGRKIQISTSDIPPFVCDYIREDIFSLPDGREMHVFFNEFGWIRKAALTEARS